MTTEHKCHHHYRAFLLGFVVGFVILAGGLYLSQPHPSEVKLQEVCELTGSNHVHCD